jgi:DNA-binding XRE family transcriptional regulator
VNLTAERINRGLSVADAANEIGIARGTLVRAEAGEMPKPALAKKIADFYGTRVTDIWPVEPVEVSS